VLIFFNIHFYFGYFENGIKSGKGLEMWSNGNIYIGTYVNNFSSGFGIYSWPNGENY